MSHPVVIALTGASGAVYGMRVLELLLNNQVPVHLVISPAGAQVIEQELQLKVNLNNFQLSQLFGDRVNDANLTYHAHDDYMAAIASGSFRTNGMLIAPCSGSTLAGIAHGYSENLITRAAEVHLKERRKLILMTRETPLSLNHIENMRLVTLAGGIVMPAAPGWYHGVSSLGDLVDFMVSRVLDQLGFDNRMIRRWGEPISEAEEREEPFHGQTVSDGAEGKSEFQPMHASSQNRDADD